MTAFALATMGSKMASAASRRDLALGVGDEVADAGFPLEGVGGQGRVGAKALGGDEGLLVGTRNTFSWRARLRRACWS